MIDVAIVDSGGANLASLQFALERLGARSIVSSDAQQILDAPRVLLPGVGAAGDAMRRLRHSGMNEVIPLLRVPLLGICLGMQLLFEYSCEDDTPCLGVFPGRIERLRATTGRPVPHMGWNTLESRRPDPLLQGIESNDYVYFVHSYVAPITPTTAAAAHYGEPFTAVACRDNFRGVQFHPERSARVGARLLKNFLTL
jgi:imidazole glycerol-phosphate synthase subunit HisH